MIDFKISLSPWIVSDGNYRYNEFISGETVEFAVEYYTTSLVLTQEREKRCHPLGDCSYRVVTEVIYNSPKVSVLDFGIAVYRSELLPDFVVGDFVECELSLEIDNYPYFERLWKQPGIQPLIYTWRINKTSKKTAPWVQKTGDNGNRWLEPDASKYVYDDVDFSAPRKPRTEAEALKAINETSTSYILHCIRTDAEPKFSHERRVERDQNATS